MNVVNDAQHEVRRHRYMSVANIARQDMDERSEDIRAAKRSLSNKLERSFSVAMARERSDECASTRS
jgi:hypothetical protein